MFPINWIAILVSALVPLIIGFVWYNPKVFGTAWMNASGLDEEKIKGANMPLIFGLSLLFALFIAVMLMPMVVHQMHIISTMVKEPGFGKAGTKATLYVTEFLKTYGGNFRTFKHGAFHGVLVGLLFVTPIIATNAMFERKGFKYIAINAGYWIVSIAGMGAIICGWR